MRHKPWEVRYDYRTNRIRVRWVETRSGPAWYFDTHEEALRFAVAMADARRKRSGPLRRLAENLGFIPSSVVPSVQSDYALAGPKGVE